MRANMKKHWKRILAGSLAVCLSTLCIMPDSIRVEAENPIVQTMYTADPSPLVVGDTMYVYTTRDERRESASTEWSLMNEWRCFSTKDMVNWTDHGQIAHAETFDRDGEKNWRAWAQHVVMKPVVEDGVQKNKYYLFAPFNGTKIDVAVSDNPWGPFEDATPGKYLIDGGWDGGNIDPAVFVEDHGNPDDVENYDYYLYWGNPYLRYCKLTDDLLDVDPDTDGDGILSEEESQIDSRFSKSDNKILGEVRPGLHSFQTYGDEGYASFGKPTQGESTTGKFPTEPASSKQKRSAFEEGPWLIKHDDGKEGTDDYFLFFVGGRTPGETIEYSTAPSPIGPWTYRGLVMDRENGYSCIHPGVAQFQGKNYLFYLNEMLVGGTGSDRSVCVKEFSYDENNLIVKETDEETAALLEQGMEDTTKGTPYFSVDAIGTLNPYELNQAETICWASNLDGVTGGFNGTGQGVKTKAKEIITEDKDPVTGNIAFWQSAAKFGVVVCDIDNNDYIKVANVDFGETRAEHITVSAACGEGLPPTNLTEDSKGNVIFNPNCDTVSGGIELWLDYGTDKECQIGTVEITNTGGTNIYQDFTADLTGDAVGVHDLYFIFRGEESAKLFNFDTWQFAKKEVPKPTPAPEIPTAAPPSGQNPPAAVTQPAVSPNTGTPPSPAIKKPARTKITKVTKKGKNKCLVKLKKVANATGYQVQYSTDKAFKKNVKKVTSKKLSCTIKKLRSGKKYYFRARAFIKSSGKTVYGAYSSIKTKK